MGTMARVDRVENTCEWDGCPFSMGVGMCMGAAEMATATTESQQARVSSKYRGCQASWLMNAAMQNNQSQSERDAQDTSY